MGAVVAISMLCVILVGCVVMRQVFDTERKKLTSEVEELTNRLKTLETYVYVMSNKLDAVEAGKKRRCG